jgi:hypothetical protein
MEHILVYNCDNERIVDVVVPIYHFYTKVGTTDRGAKQEHYLALHRFRRSG